MTRCISCGRLPTETHCDICHRVARALEDKYQKRKHEIAVAAGLAAARKMRLRLAINTEAVNQ